VQSIEWVGVGTDGGVGAITSLMAEAEIASWLMQDPVTEADIAEQGRGQRARPDVQYNDDEQWEKVLQDAEDEDDIANGLTPKKRRHKRKSGELDESTDSAADDGASTASRKRRKRASELQNLIGDDSPSTPTSSAVEPRSTSAKKRTPTKDSVNPRLTKRFQRVWEMLRDATDADGRELCFMFMKLPTRRELPDYYMFIKHPMDMVTVSRKLSKSRYTNEAQFSHDMNLIWQNAQQYNVDDSQIFRDAVTLQVLW
jgi:hypothetical protein